MGVSILNNALLSLRAAPAWILLLMASPLAMPAELKQGEISADKIYSQLRTNTMELIGNVSLEQGENTITSDEAHIQTSGENDNADFEGSVRVRTVEAELHADTVSASIVKGQLATARAEGSPAEFQQLSGAADSQGQGRAQIIEYDVASGVVKLTGGAEQVWFVYGKEKNEFRTDTLTYNMRTGIVSSGRTRGTIRLNAKPDAAADAPEAGQAAPGSSGKRGNGA